MKHVNDETEPTEEELGVECFARWMTDPVAFVRELFGAEPDEWQKDVLRYLLTDTHIAMSACKGPGKSTVKSWCGWWILACHVDAQGIALSITADNLRDGLWKEFAVWYAKAPLLQQMFSINSERIASKERPKTWFLSARSFPQRADLTQQANTLAGLHAAASAVFVLMDEVGDYPPGVLSAGEGIFANEGKAWLIVGGNPTSTGGVLHMICTRDAAHWKIIPITGDPDDPKRSPRVSLKWAKAEIDKWGRDNPWVMVNILGLFPPVGAKQLISVNDVIAAQQRDLPGLTYLSDARIWGLDPSRSDKAGADEAALARRQGILARTFTKHTWRGLDGPKLAAAVATLLLEAEEKNELPDAIFVDVGGVGASAYDHLRLLGWENIIFAVDFGNKASDGRYADKRTEMWSEMERWLANMPACLPIDTLLQAELTSPERQYRILNKKTVLKLESKEEMQKKGKPSPNRGDALSLTFAEPVMPRSYRDRQMQQGGRQQTAKTDYDPLGFEED